MSEPQSLDKLLRQAADIRLDTIRRKALYPDAQAMRSKIAEIRIRRAAVPLEQANTDVEHLLHYIDLLHKTITDLRKETG